MKKRFFKNLFGLLAVFAVTFVLFSCENETGGGGENEKNDNPDTLIYYSVSDVRSAAAGSNIVLAWTKPTENWNGVKISVSPTIPTWDSSKIYKTESTISVPNAESGTEYTITFTTVKSDGSATDKSATIKITTSESALQDTTAPSNVTSLSGVASNGGVMLTWKDASDADIFGYEVSYAVESQVARAILPMESGSIFISQGRQSCFINALTNETIYKFTVKTMDTSGNKSTGVTINVTTPDDKPKNPIAGTHLFGDDTVTIDDEEKYIIVTKNGTTTFCTLERITENSIEKIIIKKGDEILYIANVIDGTIRNIQTFEEGQLSVIPTPTGEFTSSIFKQVANYETVTSFVIPYGYTSIGNSTFKDRLNLKNVNIPDTVTIINNYAFQNTGLLKIELGDSIETIARGSFRDNSLLETIKIGSGTVEKYAFQNCVSLKNIEVKSGIIGEDAFRGEGSQNTPDETKVYKNTVYLTIGNGVTSIGKNAFRGVPIGETLIIPDSVTEIGDSAFDTRATVTNSTTNITTYYNIPESKLKTLIIENAKIGEGVFRGCSVLTDLEIKGGTIGDKVFRECPMIKNITIGKNVTAIGELAFNESKAFESITLESGNENFVYEGGILFTKDKTSIICMLANGVTVTAFTFGSDYTYIPSGIFRDNSNLESVTFTPDCKPNKIGSRAFNGTSIKTITIPSSVTEIGAYAFGYCSKLETINVESGNEYFTSEDGILYNKDKTEIVCYPSGKAGSSFTIPSTVQTIGYAAFAGNEYLESIEIGDNVTELGRCSMMDCKNLKNVSIGSNVSALRKAVFRNSPLESATFSDPTGWWYTVDENATSGDTMIDADYIDGISAKTGASTSSLGNPATAAAFLTAEFGTIERYWFKQN